MIKDPKAGQCSKCGGAFYAGHNCVPDPDAPSKIQRLFEDKEEHKIVTGRTRAIKEVYCNVCEDWMKETKCEGCDKKLCPAGNDIHWDSEGITLCTECWEELLEDTRAEAK